MRYFSALWLVLLLLSCRVLEPEDHKTPLAFDPVSAQLQEDAINIAAIIGVESRQNALLLAVEHINNAGGVLGKPLNAVPFLFRTGDDYLAVVDAFLASDIRLLSLTGSQGTLAALPRTSSVHALVLSESATSPLLTTAIDNDLLFRMPPSDAFQGKILAQKVWDEGATTAASVKLEGDAYSQSLGDVFKAEFESLGGTIVAEVDVPSGITSGFTSYINTVYSVNPEAIFVSLFFDQFGDFLNEANSQAFQGFYAYADNIAARNDVLRTLADIDQLSGSIGIAPAKGKAGNPEFEFFNQAYTDFYQAAVEPFNTQIYDLVMVLALAIEHAGLLNNTRDPTAIMVRDSLRQVMNPPGEMIGPANIGRALSLVRQGQAINYTGAYGDTDWDANGDVVGELVYDIYAVHSAADGFQLQEQVVLDVPLIP